MRSPMRQTSLPRSLGVMPRHAPDSNARRAAATARRMSSLSLSGTRAMTDASAGLNTSNNFPDAAGVHWPPMRFCFGFLSQAARRGLIFRTAWRVEVSPLPWPLWVGVILRREAATRGREAVVFIKSNWVVDLRNNLTPVRASAILFLPCRQDGALTVFAHEPRPFTGIVFGRCLSARRARRRTGGPQTRRHQCRVARRALHQI